MALAIIGVVYLVVGIIVGRLLFVSVLGTNQRTFSTDFYGTKPTRAYSLASKWAWWCIVIWIILGPMYLITAETPYEKNKRKQIEAQKLEDKMKQLEKEYNLTFKR